MSSTSEVTFRGKHIFYIDNAEQSMATYISQRFASTMPHCCVLQLLFVTHVQ